MSYYKVLREQLNCSGREFADFLGVSHTALIRGEKNQRFQSSFEIDKIIYLLGQCISKVDSTPTSKAELEEEQNNFQSTLEKRNIHIRKELLDLKDALPPMASKFALANQSKKYFTEILSEIDPQEYRRKSWLQYMADAKENIMLKNAPLAQYNLQLKIAQLELELEMNTKMINEGIDQFYPSPSEDNPKSIQ